MWARGAHIYSSSKLDQNVAQLTHHNPNPSGSSTLKFNLAIATRNIWCVVSEEAHLTSSTTMSLKNGTLRLYNVHSSSLR